MKDIRRIKYIKTDLRLPVYAPIAGCSPGAKIKKNTPVQL